MDIKIDKEYVLSIRRQLHMYPEIAFDLPRTTALVRKELESMGIPYTEEYGESSIVAFINPHKTDFSIGLRADMDALPLTEKTGLPFSSKIDGAMHACGHDAHTAMLLGTAKALKAMENDLTCRVVLLFQACEEGQYSGAKKMVDDGVMDLIDVVLGLHVENWLEAGTMGICPGKAMAASHPLHIEFFGKTAHATMPHTGANALAMAVETYNGIQTMLATQLDPFEKVSCSVGQLEGGTTINVVPDYAHMKISLRTYDTKVESFIVENIRAMAENAASRRGGTIAFHENAKALPVVNHPKVPEAALETIGGVIGKENIVTMPMKLSSEDFSFYLSKKPGAFLRLGTRNEAKGCTTLPHNNDFLIDEDPLEIGCKVFVRFVVEHMNGIGE